MTNYNTAESPNWYSHKAIFLKMLKFDLLGDFQIIEIEFFCSRLKLTFHSRIVIPMNEVFTFDDINGGFSDWFYPKAQSWSTPYRKARHLGVS